MAMPIHIAIYLRVSWKSQDVASQIDAHLSGLEARMRSLEASMTITMWALGLNLALTLAVLAKLFAMH
jgi:hypothetical protein